MTKKIYKVFQPPVEDKDGNRYFRIGTTSTFSIGVCEFPYIYVVIKEFKGNTSVGQPEQDALEMALKICRALNEPSLSDIIKIGDIRIDP